MIGDSMVPSIGSIRSVIRAAKALTDNEQAASRVPVRMAHESTVCHIPFSASRLVFDDQFRKSLRKAERAHTPSLNKTTQSIEDSRPLNSAGNSQWEAFLPSMNAKKTAHGICLNNLQLLPFQIF